MLCGPFLYTFWFFSFFLFFFFFKQKSAKIMSTVLENTNDQSGCWVKGKGKRGLLHK
jgi:hypothetical protein